LIAARPELIACREFLIAVQVVRPRWMGKTKIDRALS
jgi:hypothetical protein